MKRSLAHGALVDGEVGQLGGGHAAAAGRAGTPHTSVIAATRPPSPRQPPTTSSQMSILHSGWRSAVSSVKSAIAAKSVGLLAVARGRGA